MDETYIKIKVRNAYLYRVVDSSRNTIELYCQRSEIKELLNNSSKSLKS